jgi:Zn-dependent protease
MTIFTYKGIPVQIHPTFYLILGFLILPSIFDQDITRAFLILCLLVGLFTSVIMHEFGHALMAKRFGISTASITLYPFGGIAKIEDAIEDNRAELYIALAGPAVNMILCGLLFPLAFLGIPLCHELAWLNLIMGIFNLIPAFPMDGGRVLRASLARWMTRNQATRWCLRISSVFAMVFLGVGIWFMSVSLMLVSGVLFFFISSERKRLRGEEKRLLEWEMFHNRR